jgi:hypothetical protein
MLFVQTISFSMAATLMENSSPIRWEDVSLSDETKNQVIKGKVFSHCEVNSFTSDQQSSENTFPPIGKQQSLEFKILGLHPLNCTHALRVISQYENFKNLIDFVKESNYDEKTQQIYLGVEHSLFPIALSVSFQIPRIKEAGTYPYVFPTGFLPNLKGKIHVFEFQNRCAFYTTASWVGPHTGFLDSILSVFSSTASQIAMEKIFRVSSL